MTTDPPPGSPSVVVSGARRSGLLTAATGALFLLAAVGAFLAGGTPYAGDVVGVVLYVLGLAVGLTATVLLWIAWSERDARFAAGPTRRGVAATTTALVLVSASGVVSLGRVAPGGVQLVLIAVTGVTLATAALLARPPRP